jgi:hypothetical protein
MHITAAKYGECPAHEKLESITWYHCLHTTTTVTIGDTAHTDAFCCYCGGPFLVVYERIPQPGHGPYAPKVWEET